MDGTHLTGLHGTNPLGFLAALGVQVAFASEADHPRLWWSDGVTPHAVVDLDFSPKRIADRALSVFAKWKSSPALTPKGPDGAALPGADDLKLSRDGIRTYLDQAAESDPSSSLITALVAEGSLDKGGRAKPSDLYFTAGQQKFLAMARQILEGCSKSDILQGLEGPWNYERKLPSLMWDVSDDRVYALSANDPSTAKKLTNPGSEALAVLGLSRHPVFASRSRTLTQGCSGSWKAGHYTWPLWYKPASSNAVRSLLVHASHERPTETDRHKWFRAWGISSVHKSPIRRSSQGGYGTFGPPSVVWQMPQWANRHAATS